MLGTLTVVTVRQVEHKTSSLEPLALTRGDELVDDALGIVGEITKLGFPDGQVWGETSENPSSKPMHPYSESDELQTTKGA